MPLYAKIDCAIVREPKLVKAGAMASWLYVRCILYGRENLTDGVIDAALLPIVAGDVPNPKKLMGVLVAHGALEVHEDGWRIPEGVWRRWNPLASEVSAMVDAKRTAGAKGNHERWHSDRRPVAGCEWCAIAPGSPESEPKPETESKTEPVPPKPPAEANLDGFDEFWDRYPKRDGKRVGRGDAEKVWARMSAHKRGLALQAVTNYADSGRLPQDAHRWLRDERWDDWQTPAVPAVASTSIADNPTIRRLRQNGVPALGRVVEY